MYGIKPIHIILVIAIYIPFENFIVKWLPGGDFIRFVPELLLYAMLAYEFIKKIVYKKYYISTPVNSLVLLFFFLAIVSLMYNLIPAPYTLKTSLGGIRNLRTLTRYLAVFYIIVYNDHIQSKHLRFFINSMLFILLINIATGLFQRIFGIHSFWLPKNSELEIAGMSTSFKSVGEGGGGREMGSVIGMTGDTIYLGLFLVLVAPIIYFLMSHENRRLIYLFLLLVGALLLQFFTYSTGSLIAMAGGLGACMLINRDWGKMAYLGMAFIVMIPAFFILKDLQSDKSKLREKESSPIENIALLFNDEYINGLENSRLWVLRDVGQEVVRLENPLGYSPSSDFARSMIAKNSGTDAFDKLVEYDAMEDVYWVAMFAYYGYVGVAVFIAILLVFLYVSLKVYRLTNNLEIKILSGSYIAILASAFVVCFIVRAFEFRIFSFYFFLIPAFIMKEYLALKNGTNFYEYNTKA
jgi:hypothetical protein